MTPVPIVAVAALTAVAARAASRAGHHGVEASTARTRAAVLGAQTLAVLSVVAALVALQGGEANTAKETTAAGWVLAHAGNVQEAYQWLLVQTPRVAQAAAGGVLLLTLALMTALGCRRHFGPRAGWVGVAVTLVWVGVYAALPFHLSDAGFDDLFIVGKLRTAVPLLESNTKPFFTLWDYAYRFAEALPASEGLGSGFAANGLLYLLYTAQLALGLSLMVGERAASRLGKRVSLALLALVCVLPSGALLLSHTVFYELGGAVVVLAAFTTIELARRGEVEVEEAHGDAARREPTARGAIVLATIAFVALLQRLSFGINGFVLVPVLLHGGWTLVQLEGRSSTTALGLATVASSLVAAWIGLAELTGAALRHRNFIANAAPAVAVSAVAVLVGVIGWRSLRHRVAGRVSTGGKILLGYLVVLVLLAELSNQFTHPWLFASWSREAWYFAGNHARNMVALYPFLAGGLAAIVLTPRAPAWAQTVVLAGLALAWSVPYATRFYVADAMSDCDAGPIYQRNGRPVGAVEAILSSDERFFYLPIGRDHSDHFIARVVRPQAPTQNACEVAPSAGEHLFVSRWSLCARILDSGEVVPLPARAGRPGARALADRTWEVAEIPAEDIDPVGLASWCSWEAEYHARR